MHGSERLTIELYPYREDIQVISPKESKQTLTSLFLPIRKLYLQRLQEDSKITLTLLRMAHPDVDPMSLCAFCIDDELIEPLLVEAENAINNNKTTEFAFLYDTAMAATNLITRLALAQGCSTELPLIEADNIIEERYNSPLLITESTDIYLNLNKEAHLSLEAISTDPTGFLLVDQFVDEARKFQNTVFEANTNYYFNLAGASLARQSYKFLYPIALRQN